MSFAGKKILVTGAGKGIGKGCCIDLAKQGAEVFALSRTQKDLDDLKNELPNIHCINVDLLDVSATRDALEKLPDDITMVINNAGYSKVGHFLDVSEEDFDMIWKINVKSMFIVSQIMAKKMIQNGKGGSFVNVSSQASKVALPEHTAYCTSKGGVDQLTRMMALELGAQQIRTNALNPTVVLTKMGKMVWDNPNGIPMKNGIPQGKFAEVEDVVNAILYLLSDKSDMINGTTLPIDGGFLACRTMK
ncbi:L-xylulose reductase-like [Clytia hemisphaerica]|uniref:L-xylulose reductase n=1 Tax=Clytia hemisphaerica TaxID=252671 RepID=A0A7M5XFI5_9CNID